MSDEELYVKVVGLLTLQGPGTYKKLFSIFGLPEEEHYPAQLLECKALLGKHVKGEIKLDDQALCLLVERKKNLLTSNNIKWTGFFSSSVRTPLLFKALDDQVDEDKLAYLIKVLRAVEGGHEAMEAMRDVKENGKSLMQLLDAYYRVDGIDSGRVSRKMGVLIHNGRVCCNARTDVLELLGGKPKDHVLRVHYILLEEEPGRIASIAKEILKEFKPVEYASIAEEALADIRKEVHAKRNSEMGQWLQHVLCYCFDLSVVDIVYDSLYEQIKSNELEILQKRAIKLIDDVQWNEAGVGLVVPFHIHYALSALHEATDLKKVRERVNEIMANREVPTKEVTSHDQEELCTWIKTLIAGRITNDSDIEEVYTTFLERTKISMWSSLQRSAAFLYKFPSKKWIFAVPNMAARECFIEGIATLLDINRGSTLGQWLKDILGDDFDQSVIDIAHDEFVKCKMKTSKAVEDNAEHLKNLVLKWEEKLGYVVPIRIRNALPGGKPSAIPLQEVKSMTLEQWLEEALGDGLKDELQTVSANFQQCTKITTYNALKNNVLILWKEISIEKWEAGLSNYIVSGRITDALVKLREQLLPGAYAEGEYICDGIPIGIKIKTVEESESAEKLKTIHFGRVNFVAQQDFKKVVVKVCKSKSKDDIQHILQEWTILKHLCHKHESAARSFVPMLYNYTQYGSLDPYPLRYLVLEHYGTDLANETIMNSQNREVRKMIIGRLLFAVKAVHDEGIMHGDLKPENVLVDFNRYNSPVLKICDFDCAREVGKEGQAGLMSLNKWTRGWTAPEVTYQSKQISAAFSVDLFAMGLIIAILSREQCYPHSKVLPVGTDPEDIAKLEELLSKQDLLQKELACEGEYIPLVDKLCQLDPANRGTITDAITLYNAGKATAVQQKIQSLQSAYARLEAHNTFLQKDVQGGLENIKEGMKEISEILSSFGKLLEKIAVGVSVTKDNTVNIMQSTEELRKMSNDQLDRLKYVGENMATVDQVEEVAISFHFAMECFCEDLIAASSSSIAESEQKTLTQLSTMHAQLQKSFALTTLNTDKLPGVIESFKEQLKAVQVSTGAILTEVQKIRDFEISAQKSTKQLSMECALMRRNADGNAKSVIMSIGKLRSDIASPSATQKTILEKIEEFETKFEGGPSLEDIKKVITEATGKTSNECIQILLDDMSTKIRDGAKQETTSILNALNELGNTIAPPPPPSGTGTNTVTPKDILDKIKEFETKFKGGPSLEEIKKVVNEAAQQAAGGGPTDNAIKTLLEDMGKEITAISTEIKAVHNSVDKQTETITSHVTCAVVQQSGILFQKIVDELPESISKQLNDIKSKNDADGIAGCIASVKRDLQEWLADTIKASNMAGNKLRDQVLRDELREQHQTLVNDIYDLSQKQDACSEANTKELAQIKDDVVKKLEGMETTLKTISAAVQAFSEKLESMDKSVGELTLDASENKASQEQMINMLTGVSSATNEMIAVLRYDILPKNAAGASQPDILAVISALEAKLADQSTMADERARETTKKIQDAISEATKDLKASAKGTAETFVKEQKALLAATDIKLTTLLQSFKSSEALLRRMNELLVIIEEKSNRFPRKFIILPELRESDTDEKAGFIKKIVKKGAKAIKGKIYKPFWKYCRLFFVCEASGKSAENCGPEWDTKNIAGYKIEIPTKLTKTILPLLILGLGALKGVLQMYGIPPGLVPSLPLDLSENCQDLVETVLDIAQGTQEDIEKKADNAEAVGIDTDDKPLEVLEGRIDDLFNLLRKAEKVPGGPGDQMPVGWKPIHTGLSVASMYNTGTPVSKANMKLSDDKPLPAGSLWVLKDYEEAFKTEETSVVVARIKERYGDKGHSVSSAGAGPRGVGNTGMAAAATDIDDEEANM